MVDEHKPKPDQPEPENQAPADASTSSAGDDDEVGYCKPPKRTRFKKGQTGNPKGRPKGAKNLATLLGQVLATRVKVVTPGGPKTVPIRQALLLSQAAKAVKGDTRAADLLITLDRELIEPELSANDDLPLNKDEHAILEHYAIGLAAQAEANDGDGS